MSRKSMLLLFIGLDLLIGSIETVTHLHSTENRQSSESYDCFFSNNHWYCRRPFESINLIREENIWECHHNGIKHSFSSLRKNNITVETIANQWKSSLGMVESYVKYLEDITNESITNEEKYLCQCIDKHSFGKYCEYYFPYGRTFADFAKIQMEFRTVNQWLYQQYGDILCYRSLPCDSGLLCLDWREMCDGVQQCTSGIDEDNCDHLEFNECDINHEYRCMNGMCIPKEYFLDGTYDCMDHSDERQIPDDRHCTYSEVSFECDERLCASDQWSCGDGQCVTDRLRFQKFGSIFSGCTSKRDRFFMCEIDHLIPLWTLPNGRCTAHDTLEELEIKNRTDDEECLFYIQCALSKGLNKQCSCQYDSHCLQSLKNPCPNTLMQYPRGAILAPYAFLYYNRTNIWSPIMPDFIQINGTIRCRGREKIVEMKLPYSNEFFLRDLEALLCQDAFEPCPNQSETFHHRKYSIMNVCHGHTLKCISHYRIQDGIRDCVNGTDELLSDLVSQTCSSMKQYRFRCSKDQPSCFYPSLLGNARVECSNNYDELWMNREVLLITLDCNENETKDCHLLQEYVERSWDDHLDNRSTIDLIKNKAIPFRANCDTFWDLGSNKDEDIEMCRKYWICPIGLWQCATGQCIDPSWVLDAEWDCFDASDEENIIASNASIFVQNSELVSRSKIDKLYSNRLTQHTFATLCDFNSEFGCFRSGSFDYFGNPTTERPCINFDQINDGKIDCLGGFDEQNIIKHCNGVTMLGASYKCLSDNVCLDYESVCEIPCPNPVDDEVLCTSRRHKSVNCSDQLDFVCLNHTCIKSGRCNNIPECLYGEDEYLCDLRFRTIDESVMSRLNRYNKFVDVEEKWKNSYLVTFPADLEKPVVLPIITSSKFTDYFDIDHTSIILYSCNRGMAIQMPNDSIVCFCPPQYYGDKCQYQSDRLLTLVHLNFSQSIYEASQNNTLLVLKVLVVLLLHDEVISIDEFHVRPYRDRSRISKKMNDLVYSHSNRSLHQRWRRHLNRSNIIDEQPYSIRFEAYELDGQQQPKLSAVWQYPIYFDYLPSFRFAQVLRLKKRNESKNPCLSNPCHSTFQRCHWLQNDPMRYLCLCRSDFGGKDCAERHSLCQQGYCRSNALCKPNYRGMVSGNDQPYCVCPYNAFGSRCLLVYDKCRSNPCQNRGTCVALTDRREYKCMCLPHYHGDNCELNRNFIQLTIDQRRISHQLAVVQYLRIDLNTFHLIVDHQQLYKSLPHQIIYLHGKNRAPVIVLAKLYSNMNSHIHILSIHYNRSSVNGTTYLNESTHCSDISQELYNGKKISPYQYHVRCQKQKNLLCFTDDVYLCICTNENTRAECFTYDQEMDRCTRCLANGRCVKGDLRNNNDFCCLCPRCHEGSLCQFNSEGLSFTLDFLIIDSPSTSQIVCIVAVIFNFFIGALTNTASFITFKRSKLRKVGVGNYLLVTSILNQCSLLALLFKIFHIVVGSCKSDIICKIVSYLLSFTTRSSYWLTSWVTVERVYTVVFPFGTLPRKPHLALTISFITIVVIGMMHIHELIFYVSISDVTGKSVCSTTMVSTISTYNRLTILIHYFVPFCIQIVSITLLVLFAARSRSRTNQHRKSFHQQVSEQLKNQRELYLTPLIIVLSGLPQIIFSFRFACTTLSTWQRHALLSTYFLSYTPQLSGFILFVLPSKTFLSEFRQTSFAKNRLFRFIFSMHETRNQFIRKA